MSLKLAILASGSGTNAQVIIDKCRLNILDASVEVVICNRPGAKVIERAQKEKIPIIVLDHRSYANRLSFDMAMAKEIEKRNCQLVVLAGYMRLLTYEFLDIFKGKVINLHPALLPAFPGVHGSEDALAYGVKISGASVHFVEEKMDSGPIIIQAAVPVYDSDSADCLQNRIHSIEYRIFPQAIQWLAEQRLIVEGRHIHLKPKETKLAPIPEQCFIWPPLEEGF